MMRISMIAAVAENGVIGKDNDLVWHLPDDMRFFKDTTKNHTVLMGRKNWESIPEKYRPLPQRKNMVISRNTDYSLPPDVELIQQMEEAIAKAKASNETEFFIIGGGEIYRLGFPFANRLLITEVKTHIEGDAFFPNWNRDEWVEIERVHHPADAKHAFAFDFVIYDRK